MNHLFVSYSRKDERIVDAFTDRMREAGIRVWQDKSGAGTGIPFSTKWFSVIVEAIYLADGAIVFRSAHWEKSVICGKEYAQIHRCALPCLELDPAGVEADPERALAEVKRFMAARVRNTENSRRGTLFSGAYELRAHVDPYQLIEHPRGLGDTLEYLFADLGGMKRQMEEQEYAKKDPELYPYMRSYLKFARGAVLRRAAGVILGAAAVLAALIMGAAALLAAEQGSAENGNTYSGQAVAGQMGRLREYDPSAAVNLALAMPEEYLTFTSYYSLSMSAARLLDGRLPSKVLADADVPEEGQGAPGPEGRYTVELSGDAGSAVITDTKKEIRRTVSLPLAPKLCAAREDGGSLAFAAGSRVLVCDPSAGSVIRLAENYEPVKELRYVTEEGRSRIRAVTERGTALFWDDPVPVKTSERENIRFGVFVDTAGPLALYLDGGALVLQGPDGGRELVPQVSGTMQDTGFAVSVDRRMAAVILDGGGQYGIAVIGLEDGEVIREFPTEYRPTALAFSADSRSVCASAYGCGMMRADLSAPGVEYGPEGMYFGNIARYGEKWLLTDYFGDCVLFDGGMNPAADCGAVNYARMPCFALAVNEEKGQLFTVNRGGGSTGGCARFLPEKKQINAFVVPGGGRTDANTAVALSGDGEYVAFGYPDGLVRVYETEHMYLVWEKRLAGEAISALGFAPDGRTLHGLGASGSVYSASPGSLALNTGIDAMRENWTVLKERLAALRDGTEEYN